MKPLGKRRDRYRTVDLGKIGGTRLAKGWEPLALRASLHLVRVERDHCTFDRQARALDIPSETLDDFWKRAGLQQRAGCAVAIYRGGARRQADVCEAWLDAAAMALRLVSPSPAWVSYRAHYDLGQSPRNAEPRCEDGDPSADATLWRPTTTTKADLLDFWKKHKPTLGLLMDPNNLSYPAVAFREYYEALPNSRPRRRRSDARRLMYGWIALEAALRKGQRDSNNLLRRVAYLCGPASGDAEAFLEQLADCRSIRNRMVHDGGLALPSKRKATLACYAKVTARSDWLFRQVLPIVFRWLLEVRAADKAKRAVCREADRALDAAPHLKCAWRKWLEKKLPERCWESRDPQGSDVESARCP